MLSLIRDKIFVNSKLIYMNNELIGRLSGIIGESVTVLSTGKHFTGVRTIAIAVRFPNGDSWRYEFSASPYVIDQFMKRRTYAPLKAFHYLKKNSDLESEERLF